jgi:hypothetical protein
MALTYGIEVLALTLAVLLAAAIVLIGSHLMTRACRRGAASLERLGPSLTRTHISCAQPENSVGTIARHP